MEATTPHFYLTMVKLPVATADVYNSTSLLLSNVSENVHISRSGDW